MKNIKAAVLLAHGFNDYNVVPEHSVRIYDEMKARGLPVSIYLHQGGHGGNPPADMLNRWFSHYLYGVDNGVEKDPPVWIVQDAAAQEPRAMAALAAARGGARARGADSAAGRPRARTGTRQPDAADAVRVVPGSGLGAGRASIRPPAARASRTSRSAPPSGGADKLVDDVAMSGSADASAEQSPHRLLYATPTFDRHGAHLGHAARHAARRVEQAGGEPERLARDAAVRLGARRIAEPHGTRSRAAGPTSRITSRSRRAATTTRSARARSSCPGKFYDLTFDLQPDDEFVPAGKRLAVMIMSSDREFTLWPRAGTELTVDLAHSSFSIPIVGGTSALGKAGMR